MARVPDLAAWAVVHRVGVHPAVHHLAHRASVARPVPDLSVLVAREVDRVVPVVVLEDVQVVVPAAPVDREVQAGGASPGERAGGVETVTSCNRSTSRRTRPRMHRCPKEWSSSSAPPQPKSSARS